MSNRDDDGYNSPEGKEMSEEGQRRKAALAQLTVDGGAAEENSDESGPPKPSDMKTAIEKEKKAEVFEDRRCICSTVNLGNWIQNRCAREGFPR